MNEKEEQYFSSEAELNVGSGFKPVIEPSLEPVVDRETENAQFRKNQRLLRAFTFLIGVGLIVWGLTEYLM